MKKIEAIIEKSNLTEVDKSKLKHEIAMYALAAVYDSSVREEANQLAFFYAVLDHTDEMLG